jgi:hypothetical protein
MMARAEIRAALAAGAASIHRDECGGPCSINCRRASAAEKALTALEAEIRADERAKAAAYFKTVADGRREGGDVAEGDALAANVADFVAIGAALLEHKS